MEQIVLLIGLLMNVVGAGINLATAIVNSRNRKKLPSSAAKKALHQTRE